MKTTVTRHNCARTNTQISATAANLIRSQLLFAPVADETYCKVFVAMSATLEPYTHVPVLVAHSSSGIVVMESINGRASYIAVQVVKALVTVTENKPFYVPDKSIKNTGTHTETHDRGARNK